MAFPATGQPILGVDHMDLLQDSAFPLLNPNNMPASHLICNTISTGVSIDLPNKQCRAFTNYANVLKEQIQNHPTGVEPIPVKTVSYANGIP